MRRNPAEKRRSQHNAGKHLTHNTRLMNLAKYFPDETAYREDHRNLQDERKEIRHHCVPPPTTRGCRTALNSTGAHDAQPLTDSTPLNPLGSDFGSTVAFSNSA